MSVSRGSIDLGFEMPNLRDVTSRVGVKANNAPGKHFPHPEERRLGKDILSIGSIYVVALLNKPVRHCLY
jgi:hypothetical protein